MLPLLAADIELIEPLVRQADRDEITEALGVPMIEALAQAQAGSCKASKIVAGGEVVAVFGDAVHSVLGRIGVPWLISTMHVERHPKAFLQVCKPEVAEMLTRHAELVNYVDVRNTAAIRWLKWLGFQFDEPAPYGPNQMMFQRFRKWRAPCA